MSNGYSEAIKKLGEAYGSARYRNSWSNDDFEAPDQEAELAEIACTYHVNICDVEEEVNEVAEAYYKTLMDLVLKQMR